LKTCAGQRGGLDFYATSDSTDEWTFGPNMFYQGFRVVLHSPGTRVRKIENKGFPVLPGLTTQVVVTREETVLLVSFRTWLW